MARARLAYETEACKRAIGGRRPSTGPRPARRRAPGKLLFALLASLALIAAPFVARPAFAYDFPSPSDGTCDISWYSDDESYFEISTAEQLAGVAYLVYHGTTTFSGATIVLTDDIDLSYLCASRDWLPIGNGYATSADGTFQGTFDGGGHTVENLFIDNTRDYNALFGNIRGATIENLTVTGEVRGSTYVAGIIAYCADSDLSNLVNECTVDALTYNDGTPHEGSAAGVVCYAATAYPEGDRTFENLVNRGAIYSDRYYSAGVVGFLYNANGYTTALVDCANYGDVNVAEAQYGLDDANKSVGGVLGSTAGSYGTYTLEGCLNQGNIFSENCISVGGIAGYLGGNGSSLAYSINDGNVEGANNAGGVLGYLGANGGEVRSTLNYGEVSGGVTGGVVAASSRQGVSYNLNYTWANRHDGAYGPRAGGLNDGASLDYDELRQQDFLDRINDGTDMFSIADDLPGLTWMMPSADPGSGGEEGDDTGEDGGNDPDDPEKKEDENPDTGEQTDADAQDGGDSGVSDEDESSYEEHVAPPQEEIDSMEDEGEAEEQEEPAEEAPEEEEPLKDDHEQEGDANRDSADTGENDEEGDADETRDANEDEEQAGDEGAGEDANAAAEDSGDTDSENLEWVPIQNDKPSNPSDATGSGTTNVDETSATDEPTSTERSRQTMVELEVISPEEPKFELEENITASDYLIAIALAVLCIGAGLAYENTRFSRARAKTTAPRATTTSA